MILTDIENAFVERLEKGLGRMVNTVKSYGGELDDEKLNVGRLPMALVTYGGSRVSVKSSSRRLSYTESSFVVMVLTRSLKSDTASRQGYAGQVGVNDLVSACRRLLDAQTLGGLCQPIRATNVKTIFNNAQFSRERITCYAIEFDVKHDDEQPLCDGEWPEVTSDISSPDFIFNQYQGELSPAPVYLDGVNLTIEKQ